MHQACAPAIHRNQADQRTSAHRVTRRFTRSSIDQCPTRAKGSRRFLTIEHDLRRYPFNLRVIANGAFAFGRNELLPGADVAVSVMLPIPTEWWLRPVSSACRVGAHSAVVWNRL